MKGVFGAANTVLLTAALISLNFCSSPPLSGWCFTASFLQWQFSSLELLNLGATVLGFSPHLYAFESTVQLTAHILHKQLFASSAHLLYFLAIGTLVDLSCEDGPSEM